MIIKLAILLAILLIVTGCAAWAFLPARHLPGNRARHLRIRLHLRLHPGKGFAHIFSLWLRWSRFAVLRRSGQIRPALPLRYSLLDPGEHSVFVGRAHYRHRLHVPLEEHLLVMAPPRTYKTAFLADVIIEYPGPVLATTTKPDIHTLTSAVRAHIGPVHVFNPQHIGGVPSTFRWDPIDGCEDPATAIRRADAFAFAVSQKGVEDGSFWSAKASDYLRGYFHAAALADYDLRTVAAWVSGADPDVPERILAAAGAHHWAVTLSELRTEATQDHSHRPDGHVESASFHGRPRPGRLRPARARRRLRHSLVPVRHRHLYMIAEAVSEEAPVAPLFAAMATEIHYTAAQIGQASAVTSPRSAPAHGPGRGDPDLPGPPPSWLSDSGGKGIQIIAVVHGEAQLTGRWGEHGRQVVLDTSSVKMFLPGITDVTTLDAAAKLCGQASWKVRGQDHATRHDVASPDMIRQLPAGFALVIRGGCAPVIARLPRAWKNPAYRRARRLGQLPAEPLPTRPVPESSCRRHAASPTTCPPNGSRRRPLPPLELTI